MDVVGSLIPSEYWDWRRDWPKALAGVVATAVIYGLLAAVIVAW